MINFVQVAYVDVPFVKKQETQESYRRIRYPCRATMTDWVYSPLMTMLKFMSLQITEN